MFMSASVLAAINGWEKTAAIAAVIAAVLAGIPLIGALWSRRHWFRPFGLAIGAEGPIDLSDGYPVEREYKKRISVNSLPTGPETLVMRVHPRWSKDFNFEAHVARREWMWQHHSTPRLKRRFMGLAGWYEVPEDICHIERITTMDEPTKQRLVDADRHWNINGGANRTHMGQGGYKAGNAYQPRHWGASHRYCYFLVHVHSQQSWSGYLVLRATVYHDLGLTSVEYRPVVGVLFKATLVTKR